MEGYVLGMRRDSGGLLLFASVCQVASGEIRHERRAVPMLW